MAPVALFLAFAAGYILTSKPEWKATQSIQIRDELALKTVMPGRFDSLDMMKMVQETIHDTARRHAVVTKVLSSLEPPEDHKSPKAWPTIKDVESLQEAISLSPPNGAEFGRTEVLLLSVKSDSIERAQKTVAVLAVELQNEINRLRDQRGLSMENELEATVASAKKELEAVNEKLANFEKGCDDILIDLRGVISESGSGPSGLSEQKATLQKELRIAQQKQLELKNQTEKIEIAKNDPNRVVSFSRELLAAQPTLQKLKEQLITIQSQTAKTLGQFEKFHPKAKAAIKAESIIRQKIQEEVATAYSALLAQVEVLDAQMIRLQEKLRKVDTQISKLAEVRAPYAAIVKQVDQKRSVLNQALQDLSRAQATRAAAKTTNLISLIDGPYSGSKPEGMSKKIVLGASGVAGLLSGIGLVFFAASPNFITRLDDEAEQTQQTGDAQPEWRREVLQPMQPDSDSGSFQSENRRFRSIPSSEPERASIPQQREDFRTNNFGSEDETKLTKANPSGNSLGSSTRKAGSTNPSSAQPGATENQNSLKPTPVVAAGVEAEGTKSSAKTTTADKDAVTRVAIVPDVPADDTTSNEIDFRSKVAETLGNDVETLESNANTEPEQNGLEADGQQQGRSDSAPVSPSTIDTSTENSLDENASAEDVPDSKIEEFESAKVDFNEIQISNDIRQILEASEEGVNQSQKKSQRFKPMQLPRTKLPEVAQPDGSVSNQDSSDRIQKAPAALESAEAATRIETEKSGSAKRSDSSPDATDQMAQSKKAIEERLQEVHRQRIEKLLNGGDDE